MTNKFAGIYLQDGLHRRNLVSLFYASMNSIIFITFLNLLNPYLLREHLQMPMEVQGDFTGNLYVLTEIVTLMLTIPLGVLSDRIGRTKIFAVGFLIITVGLMLMPTATTSMELIIWRLLVAVGVSCTVTMTASINADYPQERSRGKLIAVAGIFAALGIVVVSSLILSRLPDIFAGRGADPMTAGMYTYWTAGTLSLIAAVVAAFGIRDISKAHKDDNQHLLQKFKDGLHEIKNRPRLSLACGATFVARGDLTVLAAFFALWLVAVGTEAGLTSAEAQTKAGMLFGITQLAVPLFLPIVGIITDRIDRVTALILAMGLASLGYLALGTVPNPMESWLIYPAGILTGMGEAAVIVTAPVLVGQESPKKVRGSIIGVVAFFGAIGVLANVKASGVVFDNISYQAPFILMGVLNAVIATWALLVRLKYGPKAREEAVSTA